MTREIEPNFSDDGQDTTRATGGPAGQTGVARPFLSDGRLMAGDIVGDNYEIIELLGVGGMGCVYSARHRILQKIYAMKTINSNAVTEMAWRRLQVEAQAIARINHANIVAIHNLGIHQGKLPYYVMDLLQGRNLADILKTRGSLTLAQTIPIFLQICAGLDFAHKKGIIHRDIKPGNIIILDQPDVSGATVKLVDFGIAKLAGASDPNNQNLTSVGEVFGSPFYMSPEQCEGKGIDARSDIYSVGCTLFETLTGKPPFRGANPLLTMLMHREEEIPTLTGVSGKEFPQSLENVLFNLLAKDPIDRYQTLEALTKDLQNVLDGENVQFVQNRDLFERDYYDDDDQVDIQDEDSEYQDENETAGRSGLPRKFSTKIMAILAAGFLLAAAAAFCAVAMLQKDDATLFRPSGLAPAVVAGGAVKTELLLPKFSTRYDDRIEFDFPTDIDLGKISNDYSTEKHQLARGKVIFQTSDPVHYFPSDYVIARPQIFNSFAADDLNSVSSPSRMEKGNMHENLPYLVRLKGLRRLNLQRTDFSDSDVEYLNQLPNLHILNVNFTKVTGAGLSKFKYLKNLTSLGFSGNKGLGELLKALEGSPKIDRLYLAACESPLGESGAAVLSTFKNLEHIDFGASDANDKTLTYLYDLPRLKFIDLNSCSVSDEAMKALLKHCRGQLKINREISPKTSLKQFDNELPADWMAK